MQYKHSGFIPNDPNNNNYMRNPNGTMPFPNPSSMPVGLWDGGKRVLVPQTPAGGSAWRDCTWKSPLFDLRPDLRSTNSGGAAQGVPIWRSGGMGAGGKLWVIITGLRATTNACNGLEVEFREYCSPNRPNQLVQVTDPVDLSDSFVTTERDATLLEFHAVGAGVPIRYWQVELFFEWNEALGATPQFTLFSAYY